MQDVKVNNQICVEYVNYTEQYFFPQFKKEIAEASCISNQLKPSGMEFMSYDTEAFPFRKIIIKILKEKEFLKASAPDDFVLDNLHQFIDTKYQHMDVSQQSAVAIALYETNKEFEAVYKKFLREVIKVRIETALYYQKTPNFRVFFPDVKGYPGKATYHSDIMFGHPPKEINIWVPLTHCERTASMAIMNLEKSQALIEQYNYNFQQFGADTQQKNELIEYCRQYALPLELDYGQFVLFDGRYIHAGTDNKTEKTRLTFDTRVIAQKDYDSLKIDYVGTGRKKAKFLIGEYYHSDLIS